MISASSIDVRALDDSSEPSRSQKLTHLFVLKIDGTKVLESAKVPRESLVWKEQMQLRFAPSSNISIAIHRKSRAFGWQKPVLVTEYNGRGMDFLDTGVAQELIDTDGTSRLAVKFDLIPKSHADFMKAVDEEISQLAKFKGADAAQLATTIGSKMGAVLVAIVPVIDKFASAHPLLNVAWTVLSSAYKVAQNQIAQDNFVLDLIECMREMAGAASACPDLLKIDGTADVIEAIGRASIDVARLIHDFVQPSIGGKAKFLARTVVNPLSGMPARIAACKEQCEELTKKLGLRNTIDTNTRMKQVQYYLEKSKVLEWIYSADSDTSSNYNAAQKVHLAGTGSWFLDGKEFAQWKEEPGSVLWLEGGRTSSGIVTAVIDCSS
ncbi:hypothetical protein FIBSPDRAFT_74790 [Athelia psychrophila]|uniref:C2 domain-containing protein n=1 Tax=Athelia psychrophila TaxID=1759441 RepID=A0A166EIB2_9AGAM|nr:hypothetical protein FIBSPDRAFT_74790 [Fibularhizoctonia sp. CBS 109695]